MPGIQMHKGGYIVTTFDGYKVEAGTFELAIAILEQVGIGYTDTLPGVSPHRLTVVEYTE